MKTTPSKYIDLTDRIARDDLMERAPGIAYVRDTLEWLDRNPDQVPGRTITESELSEVARTHESIRDLVSLLGIKVVPDPEPTNAEKLAADLREIWDGHQSMNDVAQWLNDNGWVKAPNHD